ncbi:hypothetical protein [Streptomyces sp. NPDC057382]|uniref:hypothetical protein n=1 Tax=unclassified Streptomyces TaxID=2593676 RepID=UPI00362A145C
MTPARQYAKGSAVKADTQAINELKAVLVIADPALWERPSTLGNVELFRTCARLSPPDGGGNEDAVAHAAHMTLRMLAERIEQLTVQIDELTNAWPGSSNATPQSYWHRWASARTGQSRC